MHLDQYVSQVAEHLAAAAALGDQSTREIADSLAGAAAPAVRLALIAALSAAADEITAGLLDAPGSPRVTVRLDGDEVRSEVTVNADEPAAPPTDDGEASARISLRLSEALKSQIEQAATHEGVSVNAWLVRAAGSALRGGWAGWAGWDERHRGGAGGRARGRNAHRVTGWIDG